MKKVLQELFWPHFFGRPYRSNGTKIHLDAALIGTKRVMPGLHIHVFISLNFLCLIFQAERHFFLMRATIHFAGTVIVKKKYCTCSNVFSKYATQNFCFIDNALPVSSNSRHERLYLKLSQTTKIELFAKIGNGF